MPGSRKAAVSGLNLSGAAPIRSGLIWFATYGLSITVAFLAVNLTRADERVAAIWLLNAVLLVTMTGLKTKSRLALGAAGVLGHLTANLLNGDSPAAALLLSGANAVELAIIVMAMAGLSRARLMRLSSIIRMALMSVVACLVSTAIAAIGLRFTPSGATSLQVVLWFCAHLLGLLLFTPVVWAALDAVRRTRSDGVNWKAWPELTLVLVVSLAVFAQSTYPLLFLVPPALILLAFRRSYLATIIGLVVMSATAFIFTLRGIGPIPQMAHGVQSQVLLLQVFVAANTFMTLMMAATVGQQRAAQARLQDARERLMRRLAEEQLLLRQAALSEEISGVGYWSLDPRTNVVFWSPQVYRIYGLDPADYRPMLETALDAYVDEDRERVAALVGEAVASGQGWTFEAGLVRADGELRRVRASSECTVDEAGQVIRLFGVFQDVTEDYRRLETIKEQEALYRLLADHVSDLIVRYTPEGQFTYISPSMERMLGYAPDELLGRHTYDVIVPEDVDQLHEAFRQGMKTGRAFSVQYRARRKNDEIVVLEARPAPDRNEAGELIGFVDVVRDVTEREGREQELAAARREAEDAAQVKADFLSNMSHEIRTPLNGVLGFAQLLRETELNEQQSRYADRISGAGSALLSVVNDILDFSKLEAGKLQLQDDAFSLRGKVEEIADIIRAAYPAIAGGLSVRIDPAIPNLSLGDPHRLAQILTNLMGNAAKFAEAGSVAVTADLAGDIVEIRIKDDGPGIAADRLPQIFEAFSQADGSIARKFGGTGLGLPISRQLARLMGGDVWLESELGLGATAVLTLPNRPTEQVSAAPVEAGGEGQLSGLKIMVVDDVDMNRELIEISLRREGHQPSVFASAAEAITALEEQPTRFDVILMDVQMPDIDGLEATRRIRALSGPASRIPIIALTANVLPQQVADCRRAGMDDHVGKPIDFTVLRGKLVRVVQLVAPEPASAPAPASFAAADPMEGLRNRYREHMGTVAVDLAALLDQPDAPPEVARLAHSLAGTAGSLGFAEVSQAAFEAEATAKTCGGTVDSDLRAAAGDLITALQTAANEMPSHAQ